MARWLAQNLGTFLLALVLAAMIWVLALQQVDPIISSEGPGPVPITLDHQPPGTIIVGDYVSGVRLTLRGPRSKLERLSLDQVGAHADLEGLGAGIHEVCVSTMISETGIILEPGTTADPPCIEIHLEQVDRRTVPIEIDVLGKPARGYQAVTETLRVDDAVLAGPVPYLDRVSRVAVNVQIADARATITQTVPVRPLDSTGQVVAGITYTPTSVTIVVPVNKLEDYRELPVTVDWVGQPAAGYSVTGIEIDPLTVLVTGSPAVIVDLPGFVRTGPVDITDARESVSRRVALVLPAGVTLVGEQNVLVTLVIEPIQVSSTITRTVELQLLAAGMTATVSPPAVDVILTGPAAVLNVLGPGDVRVFVDVFELGPGTYSLEPRAVILPEGVRAHTVLPGTVQVIIEVAPTPTPSPDGTGTPPPSPRLEGPAPPGSERIAWNGRDQGGARSQAAHPR